MVTDLPCFPTFANFRLGGFLFQKKASRTQAPPLVLTDGCHRELVLGFNSVLPGLFVKLGPKTNQTLIVFFLVLSVFQEITGLLTELQRPPSSIRLFLED